MNTSRWRHAFLARRDRRGTVPYQSIALLPASVRADLPVEAQQLYRASYNDAWARHADFADREPFCHRLARSAVRRKYERHVDGTWRPHAISDRVMQEA